MRKLDQIHETHNVPIYMLTLNQWKSLAITEDSDWIVYEGSQCSNRIRFTTFILKFQKSRNGIGINQRAPIMTRSSTVQVSPTLT